MLETACCLPFFIVLFTVLFLDLLYPHLLGGQSLDPQFFLFKMYHFPFHKFITMFFVCVHKCTYINCNIEKFCYIHKSFGFVELQDLILAWASLVLCFPLTPHCGCHNLCTAWTMGNFAAHCKNWWHSRNCLEMLISKTLATLQYVLQNLPPLEKCLLWQPQKGVKVKHRTRLAHAVNQAL